MASKPSEALDAVGVLHGKLTLTGYELPQGLTYEEWADEGPSLITMARASMFWIGDWLTYGEHVYGEKYAQAIEVTGLAVQTLKNAQWVCDRIPAKDRNPEVPFSHHRAVAALDPAPRKRLLKEAAAEGMTELDVRQRVREVKAIEAGDTETVVPEKRPSRAETLAGYDLAQLLADANAKLDSALATRDWDLVVDGLAAVVEAGKRVKDDVTT